MAGPDRGMAILRQLKDKGVQIPCPESIEAVIFSIYFNSLHEDFHAYNTEARNCYGWAFQVVSDAG